MKKKRMNRFVAVLMALVLAAGANAGNCSVANNVKAIAAEDSSEEKAFKVTIEDNMAFLPGVLSRKKQVVPPITNAIVG